jgi:hypothetical protein
MEQGSRRKDQVVRGKENMVEESKGFQGLKVWQKAYDLTLHIYVLTKNFPKRKLMALLRSYNVQQFPFRQILQKDMKDNTEKNIYSFYLLQKDHLVKQKHIYYWRGI